MTELTASIRELVQFADTAELWYSECAYFISNSKKI